jgi:hypothetical protein
LNSLVVVGSDWGANRARLEGIRVALGFDSVPVLRGSRRGRLPFFQLFESDQTDAFGPTTIEFEKAYRDNSAPNTQIPDSNQVGYVPISDFTSSAGGVMSSLDPTRPIFSTRHSILPHVPLS